MTYINFERVGMPHFEPFRVIEEKREVPTRDLTGIEIPPGIFGFYIYDENSPGEFTNVSPWYFVGGKIIEKNGAKAIEFFNGCVTSTFHVPDDAILLPVT
jgi:hypothetical protein